MAHTSLLHTVGVIICWEDVDVVKHLLYAVPMSYISWIQQKATWAADYDDNVRAQQLIVPTENVPISVSFGWTKLYLEDELGYLRVGKRKRTDN